MKKWLIAVCMILMTIGWVRAEENFLIRLSGSMKHVRDDLYKQVYGSDVFYPELRLAVRVFAGLHLWVGYGFLNVEGKTTETETETRLQENQYMVGAGYMFKAGSKVRLFAEAGYLRIWDKERALDEEVKGESNGFIFDLGLLYRLGKRLGVVFSGGMMQAKDEINGEDVDFGGIKASLGLQLTL